VEHAVVCPYGHGGTFYPSGRYHAGLVGPHNGPVPFPCHSLTGFTGYLGRRSPPLKWSQKAQWRGPNPAGTNLAAGSPVNHG